LRTDQRRNEIKTGYEFLDSIYVSNNVTRDRVTNENLKRNSV